MSGRQWAPGRGTETVGKMVWGDGRRQSRKEGDNYVPMTKKKIMAETVIKSQ